MEGTRVWKRVGDALCTEVSALVILNQPLPRAALAVLWPKGGVCEPFLFACVRAVFLLLSCFYSESLGR